MPGPNFMLIILFRETHQIKVFDNFVKVWPDVLKTDDHYVKILRIRSFSGSYFPAFGLSTERYGAAVRIQSERRKIRARKTPNTNTFHAVDINAICVNEGYSLQRNS